MKDRITPNVVFHIVLVTEIQFCMTYPSGTLPPYLLLLKIEKKIWLTKYGQMGLELSKVFRNQSFPKISSFFLPCSKSIVVTKSNKRLLKAWQVDFVNVMMLINRFHMYFRKKNMILAHRSLLPVPSIIDKSSVRINFLDIDKEWWRQTMWESIGLIFGKQWISI